MRLFTRIFLLLSIFYALGVVFYIFGNELQTAKAATDNSNVVISQVQTGQNGTGNSTKEFVELYNPTANSIDLTKWQLERRTSVGTPHTLISSMSGTIKPNSYFLIATTTFASLSADLTYSTNDTIAPDNTVLILNAAPTPTIVDKVGIGLAGDFETSAIANPPIDGSIIRKAFANSTALTLGLGGAESLFGNGYDTDNNANDFVTLTTANPRNSNNPAAISTPTPTSEPTETPTPAPTDIPTPTPTNTPPTPTNTPTPTDTPIPTATPNPTATPLPTVTPTSAPAPTATPTVTPSPTLTMTSTPTHIPPPTVTPTPTVTPIPAPSSIIIVNEPIRPGLRFVCEHNARIFTIEGFHFTIPSIQCSFIRE